MKNEVLFLKIFKENKRACAEMTTTKQNEVQNDKFIEIVGQIGKWQIWLCFIIFLIKFPSAWYQLAIIYLAPNTPFQCVDTKISNSSLVFDSVCVSNCSKYEYDRSIFENTIISEWDFVCERAWLKDFAQTVFMFGLLIGSTAFGFLADRFGRKKAFLSATIALLAFGISTSFSPDYITFMVFRFIVGFASGGTMMTSFVICMELVGAKYRDVIGILYQIPFVLGNMTLPAFAYFLRSWDTYTLGLTIPSLIFLAYIWLLPESPRWLIANGKVDEATEILLIAAKRNNLPTEKMKERVQQIVDDSKSATESPTKANFIDLFSSPVLRVRTICSCVIWMLSALYFFGVSQYISQTSSNIFISVAISGSIQLPSNLIAVYANKVFGRKRTTIVTLVLSGVCMLVIGTLPLPDWLRLGVSCLGVGGIGMTFSTIYIYSSELFPTVVRSMGMGLSSTLSRVGSMVAPFVVSLAGTAPWLPPIVFGISPLIAASFCFLLPETKGTKLPDSLADGEGNP